MPTYEYRCPRGHDFEQFYSKISDSKSALPCPQCGDVAERRISGGAGLLFKGSGFYITDYGKDGKKEQKATAASGDGKAAASGSEGASAKSGEATGGDAKPAAAPAATPAASPASKPSKPAKPSSGGGE